MVTWSLWPHPGPTDENGAIHVGTNASVILKSTNETGSHFVYWKVVIAPVSTKKSRDWFTVNCESDLKISSARTMSEVRVRTSVSLQISKQNVQLFQNLSSHSPTPQLSNFTCVDGLLTRHNVVIDIKICENNFRKSGHAGWRVKKENVTCKLWKSSLFAHDW